MRGFLFLVAASALGCAGVQGAVITASSLYPLNDNIVGSGNGTLNLRLFTTETARNDVNNPDFDADDANTALPKGNQQTQGEGYFITSIGEIRGFYALNFPGQTLQELVLFVDVNETGPGNADTVKLDDLKILTGIAADFSPANDDRNSPATRDISSGDQNSTSSVTGGTLQAWLSGAQTLPLTNQGGGFADVAIRTGFNPFDPALSADSTVTFYWKSSEHSNGGETVFLSGSISPHAPGIPEPASAGLLALFGAGLLIRPRR